MKIKILISLFVFALSMDVYTHEGHTHERYTKEQIMQIAMSAGPENVSGDATIISHDGTLLKQGSNVRGSCLAKMASRIYERHNGSLV